MAETDNRPQQSLIGYRLYRTQRATTQLLAKALEPYGITPVQWNTLIQLDKTGPLSQRKLASYLHREPATITRSIDRIEKMGLVSREPDPTDRRTNLITLKPSAYELLEQVQPAVERVADLVQSDLTSDEVSTFAAMLDKVYDKCADLLVNDGKADD